MNETILIKVEEKCTEERTIPCKNSATSGDSKHKTLVLNCITILPHVQKLVFKQCPSNPFRSKDDNKLVEDSDNTIVPIPSRVCGNSTNFYLL